MNQQRGKVQFRRIRGRIVPIRERVRSSDLAQAGVGTVLSTAGLGGVLQATHSDLGNDSAKAERVARSFKANFPDAYNKAGRPHIVLGKSTMAYPYKGKMSPMGPSKRFRVFTSTSSEAWLLHEMGHLAQARKKGSFNYSHRSNVVNAMNDITKGRLGRGVGRAWGRMLIRPWTNLGLEAEATAEAIRMAKKAKGTRFATKVGARLVLPYATYLGMATGVSLLGAAAVKNTFFEGKKK